MNHDPESGERPHVLSMPESSVRIEIDQQVMRYGTGGRYRFTRQRKKATGERFGLWSDWEIEYRGPNGRRWVAVNAAFESLYDAFRFVMNREERRRV